ncbi:striatin-interacting protein 1 homolog [Planococcus citri]|uniref:striatin-interacting protein 1 homolog n=1 Tax=Planococcus citri TaxID=170843 RepID=UPI0031F9CB14
MNEYNFTDVVGYRNDIKCTKLKDFFSRQTLDCDQENHEYPDLDFIYSDTDTLANEVAELYSYTEQPEFQLNVKAFEDYMEMLKLKPCWRLLTYSEKSNVIVTLLDQLDVLDKNVRLKCARCFLYLLQGCWVECQSDIEQQVQAKENVILLYKHGVFNAFVELFYSEADICSVAIQRKVSVNINDSTELRVMLSILYIFIEVIRCIENDEGHENLAIKEECHNEISNPIQDELLSVKLFSMVTRFCGGSAPHYPIKKVLLLIWKLLLFSLGGSESLKAMKAEKRKESGLELFEEDTIEIVKTMRASSPPSGGADGIETQNQKRTNRQLRRSLIKQSSLDESLNMDYEGPMMDEEEYDDEVNKNNANNENNGNAANNDDANSNESDNLTDKSNNNETSISEAAITLPEEPPSRPKSIEKAPSIPQHKGLPWVPKIRQKDLDVFLDHVRLKFVGFTLPDDKETLIGLPQPIHEGVKILRRYVYVSLSDVQMEREENICKYPISQKEENIPNTPAEILYQAMLPNMQQNIIALLKVLLAAAPTSKTKTDSINIMADVLPEEMPMTVLQSMKLGTDVNRHKEIIVKAVSGILLLLLKHFKLNHVYQFEFLSQYLVFANCIPLILKFFNQNIGAYVGAKNVIPILDFPSCVIGDQPELTSESLEIGDNQQCSWRNVFSCINLLRVLNKVTKWKHSRIMMLVVFKSAPILKRTLKVRHPMMQLYILKLLKMQTKYLGRQWRKSNMKTMSAIYQKVRHRLNDDWAYGNDIDARPWDFQAEECALRSAVDKFNNRRYFSQSDDPDFYSVDVDITSVLSTDVDLTEEFKKHYYLWVQQELFDKTINWDELLNQDSL